MSALKHFAVIGNPIDHSLSPNIHAAFAKQCGIILHYDKYCIKTEGAAFEAFVRDFFKQGGAGLNITLPFKQRAFQLADRLTERARLAGAVNMLTPLSSTQILGDNTDGVGLVYDITQNQKRLLAGKTILILGLGGAAKGILPALHAENPQYIVMASRSAVLEETMLSMQQESLPAGVLKISYKNLTHPFDVIINTTPLSLSHQLPPINESILRADSFCYDLVYDKSGQTTFTHWAQQQGVASCDGLGMLIEQAAEAFYHWHGIRPVTSFLRNEFKNFLYKAVSFKSLKILPHRFFC